MYTETQKNRLEKGIALLALALLVTGLLPIFVLGHYNHPTGDDYYYGVETHHIWEDSHDPGAVLAQAARGVATQYRIWQGTYSAMFFMYLAPNIFGDGAYHLVTGTILSCLTAGFFFLLYQLLCGVLGFSRHTWLTVSSVICMLCIQTVDYAGESFFWYNGSMYYTGFFALTLLFGGLIAQDLRAPHPVREGVLCLLAFVIAGGNYVSFLPALLLVLTVSGLFFLRRQYRPALGALLPALCMLAGFVISAAAPGNAFRQSGMDKLDAHTAIHLALRQGYGFVRAWIDARWILALLFVTPLLWRNLGRTAFRFRFPLIVIGYAYGILCSMFCPTLYTMSVIGPARAVAIMYYAFALFIFFSYGYALGWLHRVLQEKPDIMTPLSQIVRQAAPLLLGAGALLCIVLAALSGGFADTVGWRALRCLANGEAAAYEAEYQARMEVLCDDSVTKVVLTPYAHPADLLYVGDLSDGIEEPTNRRVAEYFGKEWVYVDYGNSRKSVR